MKMFLILVSAFLLLGCVSQGTTTTTIESTTTTLADTTTTITESTTTTIAETTTTLATNVVYSCDNTFECGWESTNGCPEQSGAQWDCVNVPKTVVNPSSVCPQVVKTKPSSECACIASKCQVKQVAGVEPIADLVARLQTNLNNRLGNVQSMGNAKNISFIQDGSQFYAKKVYNVQLPDDARDGEVYLIKNDYSFDVRKSETGENSKMYSQNTDIDGVRGAFQYKGDITQGIWGCYNDFYLIRFEIKSPVREYNATKGRWQEITLQEFFRSVMKSCKQ